MFWKRNTSLDGPALLPGLFAILVVAGALVVSWFFSFVHTPARQKQESPNHGETTPWPVKERYIESLETLRRSLDSQPLDKHGLFGRVLEALVGMRVPQEMLESHLSAALRVRALEASGSQAHAVKARQMLQDIVAELLEKARSSLL